MIAGRRLRLGLLTLAAGLAGVVLAGVALQTAAHPGLRRRWDWTAEGSAGLGARTAAALRELPEGSRATVFLFPDDPRLSWNGSAVYPKAFARLRSLLVDAAVHARGRLQVEVLDGASPLVAVERARTRLAHQAGEVLVLETPARRQVLRFEQLFVASQPDPRTGAPARLLEERVDDALGDAALQLGRDRAPKVGLLGGAPESRDQAARELFEVLRAEGFAPGWVETAESLRDQDLLLFPGQPLPLAPSLAQAVEDWLSADRPLLLALGAPAPDGVVAAWNLRLAELGVVIGAGMVCQPVAGQIGLNRCVILEIPAHSLQAAHPATRALAESGRGVVLRLARPVRLGAGGGGHLRTELLWTTQDAWIDRYPDAVFAPGAERGLTTLGVAAERLDGSGRVLVLGSTSAFYGALDLALDRDLVVASVRWLLGDEDRAAGLVGVQSLPFRLDASAAARLSNLAVLALPGVIFLLGLIVFVRRRR